MRRFWPAIAAGCILLAAGLAYGWRTDRWGSTADLAAAAARLENLPVRVGDWESVPVEVPAEQVRISRAAGIAARKYTHRFTGSEVTVLIVCGRPGPISVHTPDICYQGAGFVIGPARTEPLPGEGNSAWVADFKKDGAQPLTLRIRWAWGTGDAWMSSTSPRFEFAREPVLYKMYIVQPVAPGGDPADKLPELEFLKEFLPVLSATLNPPQ